MGTNWRNRGGKAAKAANNVTPAGSRRSNRTSTAVASAAPDYSSDYCSGEDQYSSGDEVSGTETTPWVRSNIQKLRRSNESLVSGRDKSKKKEAMYKTQIDELNSVVGQLHRDRVDKEIVAADTAESHQAQIKAIEDRHLDAINKLKSRFKIKQNKCRSSVIHQTWYALPFFILPYVFYFNSNRCLSLIELYQYCHSRILLIAIWRCLRFNTRGLSWKCLKTCLDMSDMSSFTQKGADMSQHRVSNVVEKYWFLWRMSCRKKNMSYPCRSRM